MKIISKYFCLRIGECLGFETQKEYGLLLRLGKDNGPFIYLVWRHKTPKWYEIEKKYLEEKVHDV